MLPQIVVRCILLASIIIEMCLELNFTCGKYIYLTLDRDKPVYLGSHNSHCMSLQKPRNEVKELSVDLCDTIVVRHKSGKGYKTISKAVSVLRSTVASVIVKWNVGTTGTLP